MPEASSRAVPSSTNAKKTVLFIVSFPPWGFSLVVDRATASYHSGLTTLSFIQSFIARVQSAFQSGLL